MPARGVGFLKQPPPVQPEIVPAVLGIDLEPAPRRSPAKKDRRDLIFVLLLGEVGAAMRGEGIEEVPERKMASGPVQMRKPAGANFESRHKPRVEDDDGAGPEAQPTSQRLR